jgi:rhamnogalacturonan acetylesterase
MNFQNMNRFYFLILLSGLISQIDANAKSKPTVYTIGDSTVKNGKGDGAGGLWGWGDAIIQYFDTTKVDVENHALGGTSSRTFQTKGLWDKVRNKLKPGDFVLMQFGHNDNGPLNDTLRARGTIKGVGNESEEIDNLITSQHEVVHSYGWYLKEYIRDAKSKGAVPIVFSQIPRNEWPGGKVERVSESFGKWAKEAAVQADAFFIDLNELVAKKYEKLGPVKVKTFFPGDHTHTNKAGAELNAETVIQGIRQLKSCALKVYLAE